MDVQRLHAKHHSDRFKIPQSEDFAVASFDQLLAEPGVSIYLAEEDGQAIGYIVCKSMERPETPFTFAARYLYIDQISVRPAAQRLGAGAALIKQAQSLAKELDISKMLLDSWDFNTEAHAFFESLGVRKFNYRFWRDI